MAVALVRSSDRLDDPADGHGPSVVLGATGPGAWRWMAWENREKPVVFMGFPWDFMGTSWEFMGFHGISWDFMGTS